MPAGSRLRDIGFVDRHRRLVGRQRRLVVADAEVDVERHVHEMARARHGGGEPLGVRQRPFRRRRGFHHVDVVVDRARMVRTAGQHRLERGEDLGGLALGLGAARLPVVPGREIHQRLGVEDLDVVVLRKARRGRAHGGGVSGVERGPLGLRIGRVALRDRLDQRLLARARRPRVLLRLEHGRHRGLDRLGVHRRVDVGTEHQRLAERAHRAIRIELLRRAEGARRLGMIEAVGEPQPLIEVALRHGIFRGDRKAHGPEIVIERHIRRHSPCRRPTRPAGTAAFRSPARACGIGRAGDGDCPCSACTGPRSRPDRSSAAAAPPVRRW